MIDSVAAADERRVRVAAVALPYARCRRPKNWSGTAWVGNTSCKASCEASCKASCEASCKASCERSCKARLAWGAATGGVRNWGGSQLDLNPPREEVGVQPGVAPG